MKKLLMVLVLMPVMALAEVETVGDVTWSYRVSSAKVTVKGAEPCAGTQEIPQTLGGYPVSSIGAAAFSDCENLTEIVIPEGVADIGAAAFCDCSGLTSITIVDGKETISYTPELDDARKAMRKYTTWGKKSLMDANWTEVPQGHETEYNFFKVSVEMR